MACPVVSACLLGAILSVAVQAGGIGSPVAVNGSGVWSGFDGPWSSFELRLLNQTIHVLPAASLSEAYLMSSEVCTSLGLDQKNCFDANVGDVYDWHDDWSSNGNFSVDIWSDLGYDSTYTDFRFLEPYTDDFSTVEVDAIIGSWNYTGFGANIFGISPKAVDFVNGTERNGAQSSFLQNLADTGWITSRSWSYTAGAVNGDESSSSTPASFVIGGYNTARFNSSQMLRFDMSSIIGQELTVDVQQIYTIDSATPDTEPTYLGNNSFSAWIEPGLPYLWLPLSTCLAFESAFNLTWDTSANLYLVSESLHTTLIARNPSISFNLGPNSTDSNDASLTLPYSAFDLNITAPLVQNASRYFPLKRAADNATQNALGRAFLQHAHILVDHDRRSFNLSQAIYDPSVPRDLVNVTAPTTANSTAPSSGPKDLEGKLSAAAAAGIAVAAIVLVGGTLYMALSWHRRHGGMLCPRQWHWHWQCPKEDPRPGFEAKAELDGSGKIYWEMDEGVVAGKAPQLSRERHRFGGRDDSVGGEKGGYGAELAGCMPVYELAADERRFSNVKN
ncbi:hypothetical protein K490DRAFT_68566 [Saccharata proteae CBS 121410]|uniref:Peptidase A1 domain-containing protein n=1 Tax=Saccharata proteae CBS 121410 TaxID=1314787 RepID=A0A9P4HQ49_9PEZI|nr:hypothetical protein K490DRAFT_68566 [Saccharata proteae CBS 121410]